MSQNSAEIPRIGDNIRTKSSQLDGKVVKIDHDEIIFKLADGRLMRTSIHNALPVEKLADEETDMSKSTKRSNTKLPEGYTVVPPIDRDRWQERAGLEGPFRARNGKVVYYDPIEGKYYDPESDFYISYDEWAAMNEGSMGGLNRSAPGADVSYEKVLDEVKKRWMAEQSAGTNKLNELSIDTMQKYRNAVSGKTNRSLYGLEKGRKMANVADKKIAAATGDRTGNNSKTGPINSYHKTTKESLPDRLAEIMNSILDEADFSDILNKQYKDQEAQVKKKPVVEIPYHGWTIKYRPAATPDGKVEWMVIDRKGNSSRGSSMTEQDAVRDAEEWINTSGPRKTATSDVNIDFNAAFAKEFTPTGEIYVKFDKQGSAPVVQISLDPQAGFKKTHPRQSKSKLNATALPLPGVRMSSAEANAIGFQPNGRYVLGDKQIIDNGISAYPLIFQSIVQDKNDQLRLNVPALTVAHDREVNEVYAGPWQGDPAKYAKAPKTTTRGSTNIPLSELVKDSVEMFGVKWAFNYYVKKWGMPPRHFRIYAGI